MKKEKKIINLSQLLSFGSILMVGIIFIHNFSYIMGLGLSSTFALIASAGYVGIPTIIAAVLSFIFCKFKFKSSNFFKFWFWIMLITSISYFANSLTN
tara:strand:+ start:503 stop:796 length:294 start_codon:yes stop_codon:yes gene_type:complete